MNESIQYVTNNYIAFAVILAIAGAFANAMFCAWLAEEKGRDKGTWALLGFFCGIIAAVALAGAPELEPAEESYDEADLVRVCPDCGRKLALSTNSCPGCGTSVA